MTKKHPPQATDALVTRGREMRDQWLNGNRTTVDYWIGNSATRLLAVLTAFAAIDGTDGARRFLDGIRNRRGF